MNKRQKIKKWFKDHFTKKSILNWLFVGLIALIVILCIYFENKDKETMQNKESNISIVNDNIDLKKDLIYTSLTYSTTNLVVNNNLNEYLKDFNNVNTIASANLYCLRFNLNNIKSDLLSYNNNYYAVDLSNVYMSFYFSTDYYWSSGGNYVNIYNNFTNENVNFNYIKTASPILHNYFVTNANGGVEFKINFDYSFLDIYYVYFMDDERTDEFFLNIEKFNIFDSDSIYYNQQLQVENNALQERINNLEIQLDDALLGQDIKYNLGYQVGLNEGASQDLATNGFTALLNSIFSYPINFISTVFNFNFMGINVASILLFLVSIGVVLFVVKRLWK